MRRTRQKIVQKVDLKQISNKASQAFHKSVGMVGHLADKVADKIVPAYKATYVRKPDVKVKGTTKTKEPFVPSDRYSNGVGVGP